MNHVVLIGRLSSDPQVRTLASGSVLYQFEVTTTDAEGAAATVPVAWFDPPRPPEVVRGSEVVVAGSVRRRFFRGPGGTQSRTEVVATGVLPAARRAATQRLLQRELAKLGDAVGGAVRSA